MRRAAEATPTSDMHARTCQAVHQSHAHTHTPTAMYVYEVLLLTTEPCMYIQYNHTHTSRHAQTDTQAGTPVYTNVNQPN